MIQSNYKHQQLSEILRDEIHSGTFPEGRFHTVKALMERFQVSQATLTRALRPLYADGLIYSVSGKGTFLSPSLKQQFSRPRHTLTTIYCIAPSEDMFDPAGTSPDWCFTQLVLKGIVAAARKHNLTVNVAPMAPSLDAFRTLADQEGAMFLFLHYPPCEQQIEYVIKKQIPYALYTNTQLNRDFNTVFCNVGQATENITSFLIQQGHRNIAFLGDRPDSTRHRGFRRALRKHGITPTLGYNWYLLRGLPEAAQLEVERRIHACPEVTAIVASTDLRAIGAWRALTKFPEKRALISIDNIYQYYNFTPALTSMDMNLTKAGESLLEILLEKIKDGNNHQRIIPYTLKKGETA